jgi:5'-nucleotidase
MAPALERVRALQATPLSVILDTPLQRSPDSESPLGNLFADALREGSDADVAFNNNVRGGLRADLPAGALTFGRLYDVFPFDNRLMRLTLSGADLETVLADEIRRNRPGALAISGVQVRARCSADGLEVELLRPSSQSIAADERLVVVAMDSLVLGAVFASVRQPDRLLVPSDAPVMREVVEDWLRRGGHLDAKQFVDSQYRRWDYSAADLASCIE